MPCSFKRLEAQLSSLFDGLGSVQFRCLRAQVTAQTTSVGCAVRTLEDEHSSLLNVLGSVQFGWCRRRLPPMLVHALLSVQLGGSSHFTFGRSRFSAVRVHAHRGYRSYHLDSVLSKAFEAQLGPLLDVLGSVQFGGCRQRPTPMLVYAMLRKTFGWSTPFTVGGARFGPVRLHRPPPIPVQSIPSWTF